MQLSLIQHKYLSSLFWWNPLPSTEYFIKGGNFKDHIYIMITNLNKVWICKLNFDQIVKEKQIYNKMVEIQNKDLMALLGSKLEKYFQGGVYHCSTQGNKMEFKFQIYLKIYLFNWTFELYQTKINVGRLIRQDLIKPLLMALNVTQSKCQALQKQVGQKARKQIGDVDLWANHIRQKKKEVNVNKIGGWNQKLIVEELQKDNIPFDSQKQKQGVVMSQTLHVLKQQTTTKSTLKVSIDKKERSIQKVIISRRSASVEKINKKKKHQFL